MRRLVLFFLLLALSAGPLCADGGAVLARGQSGPFLITVFTDGASDWSVLVQRPDDGEPVLDARVSVDLKASDASATFDATREAARNKLLYAAPVLLPHGGPWTYRIAVTRGTGTGELTGTFESAPPTGSATAFWPYFAFPVVCVLLFALHQRLSAKSNGVPPPVRDRFPLRHLAASAEAGD